MSNMGDGHLPASTPEEPEDLAIAEFKSVSAPLPKTPEMLQRIRIKNRRKRYLDTHPGYFSPSLELAGLPISSDSKISCAENFPSAIIIR